MRVEDLNGRRAPGKPRFAGVIPARGGSKSVPLKNIALVAGRPLLAYTIDAARASGCLDRVLVSTDSERVAEVAEKYGGEVAFLRPPELAQDDTPRMAVILHALRWLRNEEDKIPEYMVTLQPTSPLRTAQDIHAAVDVAIHTDGDAVISVCPADHHPYWAKKMNLDGTLTNFVPQGEECYRRQDLPPAYALNGAVFVERSRVLLRSASPDVTRTFAYVMPPERSVDIDSAWDLQICEWILQRERYAPKH